MNAIANSVTPRRYARLLLLLPFIGILLHAAAAGAEAADLAACGNGVLEEGEDCQSCATDCTVRSCTATAPPFIVQTSIALPTGRTASSVTVRLAYRSDRLSLPGKGADTSIRDRVTGFPSGTFSAVNDLGYALRVVASVANGIAPGPLFTAAFDPCQGAQAPTLADVACVVEGCGSQTGLVTGCTCTLAAP